MIKLNDASYKDAIKAGNVLIDVYADWCYPCKRLLPILEEVSKSFGNVVFYKVEADSNPNFIENYSISSLPTLLIIKNGEVIDKIVGLIAKDALINRLNNL